MGLMGWFGGSTKDETPDAASREDRQRCWDTRDAYFKCLDGAGVVKPGDEKKACAEEQAAYGKSCAKSWIEYFNKRRVLAEQQKGLLIQANNQSQEARKR